MQLLDVLDKAMKARPNAIDRWILVEKLFQGLEGDVADMIGMDPPEYTWDESNPEDRELLMPYPYDDIYHWYLLAIIDDMNEETQLYENDMAVFNSAWARAQAWYRRNTHKLDKRNWRVM